MRSPVTFCTAVSSFLLLPCRVLAACLGLELVNVPSTATFQSSGGEYVVYNPAEYLQTVNFEVKAEAAGGICDYFVALSTGQSGNFSQRKLTEGVNVLHYNVYVTA